MRDQRQYNTNFRGIPRRFSGRFREGSLERIVPTRPTRPASMLETFPNPAPARDYVIHMRIPEFTCLCPKTGQPDFATLTLDYVAERRCVELKSLKLYIGSYRSQGAYHEAVTNRILDDLVAAVSPRFMRLVASFYVRGGIFTTVVAEHRKRGWKPSCALPLPVTEGETPARA
ncbi:MAG: NADPH-dependent 7-cyano-7-deazaguanine reductase QueF [Burkholderiales bacterium]|nr:NADPH-dependent 7-cyano-7-deazaguanine reductase QueF [Burkholderiales bacterium]